MPLLQTPAFDRLVERPPIILIGMHRSGTSLMSRLFSRMGIFMGSDWCENAESRHVRAFSERTLRTAGSAWNDPARAIAALQEPVFAAEQAAYYRTHLFSGIGGLRYWGWARWWGLRRGDPVPVWGWKDPRTSITLSAWLRLFPDARVVHIIRNGIDVAISLHRRQIAKSKRWRVHPDHRDPRGVDFCFWFELWEVYQRHLLTYRDSVAPDRYTELRYEQLLREPEATLRHVLSRLDLPVDEESLSAALSTVNAGRLDNRTYAAAYQAVIPELVENPLMKALDYSEAR